MGRKKSYDRSEVLEKAMQLFWKKGYEGTHLSELLKETGLNKFSLYNEFGGKAQLFHACLALYLKKSDTYYNETLNKRPYGLDNIRQYFQKIQFAADYHGCFFVHTLSEPHVTPELTYRLAQDYAAKVEGFYRENIDAAIENGALPEDTDPRALAQYFTMADLGLSVFGICHGRSSGVAGVVDLILGSLASGDKH